MFNLKDIKLVLYDFDDTLCIHHGRGYTEKDEDELDCKIYEGCNNPWKEHDINRHMLCFMDKCKTLTIRQGLLSVVSSCPHGDAKVKWVENQYGFHLDNFCVGTKEEKIRALRLLSTALMLQRYEILVIDDRVDVLNEAARMGFIVWSPLEVVNYVEEYLQHN